MKGNKCIWVCYRELVGLSYDHTKYEEWRFGIMINTAEKNKGWTATHNKVLFSYPPPPFFFFLSFWDFLEEFLIMDAIFHKSFCQ